MPEAKIKNKRLKFMFTTKGVERTARKEIKLVIFTPEINEPHVPDNLPSKVGLVATLRPG